jgi:hypothetical protein
MGGWSDVKDVGDRESRRYARCWADTIGIGGLSSAIYSYDLHGYCGSQEYFIEVKVSLSLGASAILTRNEVDLHRREHPHNALFVVHSIDLDRSGPVRRGRTRAGRRCDRESRGARGPGRPGARAGRR